MMWLRTKRTTRSVSKVYLEYSPMIQGGVEVGMVVMARVCDYKLLLYDRVQMDVFIEREIIMVHRVWYVR
jgi:hypothetical protein